MSNDRAMFPTEVLGDLSEIWLDRVSKSLMAWTTGDADYTSAQIDALFGNLTRAHSLKRAQEGADHEGLDRELSSYRSAMAAACLYRIDASLIESKQAKVWDDSRIERLERIAKLRRTLLDDEPDTIRSWAWRKPPGGSDWRSSLVKAHAKPEAELLHCAQILDWIESLGGRSTVYFPVVKERNGYLLKARITSTLRADGDSLPSTNLLWAPSSIWTFDPQACKELEAVLSRAVLKGSDEYQFIVDLTAAALESAPPNLVVEGNSFGLALGLAARAAVQRQFIRPAILTGELGEGGAIHRVGDVLQKYRATRGLHRQLGGAGFYYPKENEGDLDGIRAECPAQTVASIDDAESLLTDGLDALRSVFQSLSAPPERMNARRAETVLEILSEDADGEFFHSDWDLIDNWIEGLAGALGNRSPNSDGAFEKVFAHLPSGNDPSVVAHELLRTLTDRFLRSRTPYMPIPLVLNSTESASNPTQWVTGSAIRGVRQYVAPLSGVEPKTLLNEELERCLQATLSHFPERVILICYEQRSPDQHNAGSNGLLIPSDESLAALWNYLQRLGQSAPEIVIVGSSFEHANYCVSTWEELEREHSNASRTRT